MRTRSRNKPLPACIGWTHVETEGQSSTARVGSVVLATGFVSYDAKKLTHLGYPDSRNVITCSFCDRNN